MHYVETKEGYHQAVQHAFSLRQMREWLKYFFGVGQHYQPRVLSPAQRIKSYSRLLTLTILALALGGSMDTAISQVQGTWTEGLQAILFQSTLAEMVEWISGVLFALTLVIGSQRITAYVAQRAAETLSDKPAKSEPQLVQKTKQPERSVMHDLESESVEMSNFLDDDKLIAEWVIDADNLYTETCEDCGWTTEAKDSHDSAVRALRAHQARYCPILFEHPQQVMTG